MHEKNYLTREEQRIWEHIEDKEIIDNELISLVFPELSRNKRNKLLHNLCRKRYLHRAARDIYYNPEKTDDFYKLALRIHQGYIGLTSALKLHNLLEYEDFTIFVITKHTYKTIKLKNYLIKYLPLEDLFRGFIEKNNLIISTVEKTLFDCLLRIRYLNYNILTKAFYDAKSINWREFLGFFKSAPKSLSQKAGYILEMMKKETDFSLPGYVLETLNRNITSPLKLGYKKSSAYNAKWKLEVSLEKEQMLSWWYR